MLELSQPQTLTKNDGEYFTLYPCKGRTRTYTFSIDACAPVRTMTKRDICPCDTAKVFQPAHVAAILHFLGPAPDEEDYAAMAA
jgi:hypothetical protein